MVCPYLTITLEVIRCINKACSIWILLKTTDDKRKIVGHTIFFLSSATDTIPFSVNNMENRTFPLSLYCVFNLLALSRLPL